LELESLGGENGEVEGGKSIDLGSLIEWRDDSNSLFICLSEYVEPYTREKESEEPY
jgi:hypothetical protein